MNNYELLVIIKATLTDEEINAQVESVKSDIANLGGEVLAVDAMGVRKLAYEINKNPRGYYAVFYHKSPASSIEEIERKLRYNENVLKFFTYKYSKKKEVAHFEKLVANAAGSKEESKEETASSEA